MNNKGFTLVEIISVVALLALVVIITVPIIGNVGESVKKKTLETKIENIEKAAVLYGQNHRGNFTAGCDSEGQPCYNITGECKCYSLTYIKDNGDGTYQTITKTTIPVSKLITPSSALLITDEYSNQYIETDIDTEEKGYIEPDKEGNIINPVDESQKLNECKIQIYKKYGKIYAVYDKGDNITDETEKEDYQKACWYN